MRERRTPHVRATVLAAAAAAVLVGVPATQVASPLLAQADPTPTDPRLVKIGGYDSGSHYAGAEIAAFGSNRLFITNGATNHLDIVDASNPASTSLVTSIDMAPYGSGLQSVDVHGSVVAVAVQGATKVLPGSVVFFDLNGGLLAQKSVGALPDMVTFTPDGTKVVVANEGEPRDYCAPLPGESPLDVDPEGSVSVIDLSGGVPSATVANATFTSLNGTEAALRAAGIRIFGPNATAAQDLEPEYVAVSADSTTAYVTLQENNAMATVDLATATVTGVVSLGYKDHSAAANALDPSDRDGPGSSALVNIVNRPVLGMYMPDAVATFESAGTPYLVMANEGDAREWNCLNGGAGLEAEDRRAGAAPGMDPTVFAGLTGNAQLGRLGATTKFPATFNGSNQFTSLYSFGARSFTIRDTSGSIVFDSGADIETRVAAALPARFNSDFSDTTGTANGMDSRSDNKGPEPEGIAVGSAYGSTYAFVGLERVGGVMVYDLANPAAPRFVQYINTADFTGDIDLGTAGDVSPEGLHFVPAADSPTGKPLVIVAYELSGTTAIFELTDTASIDGTVTEEGGGALPGMTVGLYPSVGSGRLATAITDASGQYHFDVAGGSYRLKFSDPLGGHKAEWYDDQATHTLGADVPVVPGDAAVRDAALTPLSALAAISGTVSDSGGPVTGGTVGIYKATGGLVAVTSTNGSGGYSIGMLPPGTYKLKFMAPGHMTEWYDEATTAASSTNVVLGAGDNLVFDETLLLDAETLSISGAVTDAGAVPIAGAAVRLYTSAGFTGTQVLTDGSGSYTLPSLNPGTTWYLRFSASGFTNEWFSESPVYLTATGISQPAGGPFVADASLT